MTTQCKDNETNTICGVSFDGLDEGAVAREAFRVAHDVTERRVRSRSEGTDEFIERYVDCFVDTFKRSFIRIRDALGELEGLSVKEIKDDEPCGKMPDPEVNKHPLIEWSRALYDYTNQSGSPVIGWCQLYGTCLSDYYAVCFGNGAMSVVDRFGCPPTYQHPIVIRRE